MQYHKEQHVAEYPEALRNSGNDFLAPCDAWQTMLLRQLTPQHQHNPAQPPAFFQLKHHR